MAKAFIFSDDEQLSFELISLALQLEFEPVAITMSEKAAKRANSYGSLSAIQLNGPTSNPEDCIDAIADIVKKGDATAFFVGDTEVGRNIGAQVSAALDAGMASCVSDVVLEDGRLRVTRTVYGGAIENIETIDGLQVLSIPYGRAEATIAASPSEDIVPVEVDTSEQFTVLETSKIEQGSVDISQAKRIVCAGMGFGSKEDLVLAEDLADVIEGELACTRPLASDREWMNLDLYIGLSGKVVAPELLVEVGVSGQIQHTYGIRESKIIAAIDSNESSHIFDICDFGIVGDLYEVLPKLTEALARK